MKGNFYKIIVTIKNIEIHLKTNFQTFFQVFESFSIIFT